MIHENGNNFLTLDNYLIIIPLHKVEIWLKDFLFYPFFLFCCFNKSSVFDGHV
jgi:hypothetical protein